MITPGRKKYKRVHDSADQIKTTERISSTGHRFKLIMTNSKLFVMKKNTVLLLFLLGASLITINCTKERDGNWHGTTSTGMSISFWVDKNKVWNFSIESCTFRPVDGAGISGKKFSISDNGVNIKGKFSSDNEASGTITINNPVPCTLSVSSTWTATKN